MRRLKPPCSWPGGKANFAETIGDKFQGQPRVYVEPFLGMGAVLLHLLATGRVQRATVGDVDVSVVMLWRAIREQPVRVSQTLHQLCADTSEDAFYRVRAAQNEGAQDCVEHAARMIYLSKLAFGGVFRRNKSGALNMPYGKGKQATPEGVEYFQQLSRLLQHVDIVRADGREIIATAMAGDWVYADPPYADAHSYGAAQRWSMHDTAHTVDALNVAAERGAACVFSEHDRLDVRALLAGWSVDAVSVSQRVRRMNTLDGAERGTRNEIIAWR